MKKFIFALTIIFCYFSLDVHAMDRETKILSEEYNTFYNYVSKLKPDGILGGFLYYKKIDNYEILWKIAEDDNDYTVIRLYNEHQDGSDDFALSYFHAKHIIPGVRVIRRFAGPAVGAGWRNDTSDLEAGKYIGSQGLENPVLNQSDKKILKEWKITLF